MSRQASRLRRLMPSAGTMARVRRRPAQLWAGTSAARISVAALVGLQVALISGGPVGIGAGVLAGVLIVRWLARLEPTAVRRRRQQTSADLPLAVDLLIVCLRAGRPIGSSLGVVAAAVAGPLGADLTACAARLELGGDPRAVLAELSGDPVLGAVGRAIVRALDTGSPVGDSLAHLVEDLRRDRVADADETARRVAVRSAGPLGLCFLPAFVLVGVAPTIVGAFSQLIG
jgi:Flp pilus assembly protein TadB